LESKLANDPEFFCEVLKLVFRSRKEDKPEIELTNEFKGIATNAWHLLHKWKTLPGMQKDGTVNEANLLDWLQGVKQLCTESGHLEVALISIGKVLIHSPADPDGLWINRAIANVLNDRDSEDIRDGYRSGLYNARGVHWIDPTGKPEKDLAEEFYQKAEDVENAGYQRLAATLRELADSYEWESDRIVNEHEVRDED